MPKIHNHDKILDDLWELIDDDYNYDYEYYEESVHYETELDRIPIEEIEKYLRKKKLERINKK